MRVICRSVYLALVLLPVWTGQALAQAPVYTYDVINRYPHDPAAFTQGLVLQQGRLFESTGLNGSSSLREVNLTTGAVLRIVNVPSQYFAEGMTIFQGKVFQLTWRSQVGFIYNPDTFAPLGQFSYAGEGWGLTHDAQHLILSDGTNQIRFLDPVTFQVVRSISVLDGQGQAITNINELEYINGEIFANIWQTNLIARINPQTGALTGWVDLTGLLPAGTSADVLNGIAYDPATGHLLVTGKLWPYLFEITLRSATTQATYPQFTAPAPGTTLSSTTVTFQWTAGAQTSSYWLYLGSVTGGNDLASQNLGTALSATVNGLPSDGRQLHARLWWLRSGNWEYADAVYTASGAAGGGGGGGGTTTVPQLTAPVPGSALTGSTATFQWTAALQTTQYWVTIGSSAGARDVADVDRGANTSATLTGLPVDGRTLYFRLWYLRAGTWAYVDATYNAAALGGGGGGTTAVPQITSPTPGSTLTGSSATLQWTAASQTTQYWVTIGSSPGGRDLADMDRGANTSAALSGLPVDGRTLYLRLWYLRAGVWLYVETTFTAASLGGGGGGGTGTVTAVPQMIAPAPGSALSSGSATFQWTAVQQTTQYWVYIGSSPGAHDLVDLDRGTGTSAPVSGLPVDGRTLYLRLWYLRAGVWTYADWTFAAASGVF